MILYHRKSKQGPSHMYSILKMYITCEKLDIKSTAENVITKFLVDEGIIDDSSHEIQIWLKHLYNKSLAPGQDALLQFLDSIFFSVAMEPYTYTDIVMEMTSQASIANRITPFQDSIDSSSRVAFSPLVVRALMAHVESVSSEQDGCTATQLGMYVNCSFLV
ncbi:Nucleolar pre-ribosomal-associated protein 1 [Exaiptasia diaphana]|nr:Nucleolar pre-ribosomal-associated protein 1 [Exaiptasia diaphana]